MKLPIDVNLGCLEVGVPEDPEWCPIAYAVRAALPEAEFVNVDDVITCVYAHARWKANHTNATRLFMTAFDDGQEVSPFTAELNFHEVTP